jgi:hypothetical protein
MIAMEEWQLAMAERVDENFERMHEMFARKVAMGRRVREW